MTRRLPERNRSTVNTVSNRVSPAEAWETIPEIVQAARESLLDEVWDYSCGGAESEVTLRRNRSAFEYLAFKPHVLRGVSQRDTSTIVLGAPLSLPVMLAPVGSIVLFDPEGAAACARAAKKAGTAAFVGTLASPSLEAVRTASDAPLFFQLYLTDNRDRTRALIQRAEDARYDAICLTVDSAVYGRRERDLRNRFRPRDRAKPNVQVVADSARQHSDDYRAAATWDDVEWLRATTSLPIMLKGIMRADDARRAVDRGVDAIYVSNHGGRQLDHNAATIEVLPEIVDAVGAKAEVLLDGGIMRGTDVVKALALGARAVLIGKLMTWGLAAGGVDGLVRALDLLRLEISITMANLGVSSLAELSPELLRTSVPPLPDPWPTALR